MDNKKSIAEDIYAFLVERYMQKSVDIAQEYIAAGGDLLGVLDSIFEKQIKNSSDVKIFYFFVAFCLSLGKDDYVNNIISRFHINLFLHRAPEFFEANRINLLSVKNVNFYRRLFLSAVRGLGVLNYENEDVSGEKYLIHKLLSEAGRPVVFDVGANVGKYSSAVKRVAANAQVYAFEPNPATFVRLKERAKQEGFFVFNIGLSDKEEKCTLFDRAEFPEGSSHASLYQSVIEEIHKVESSSTDVLLTTLDAFLQKIQFDSTIDLLKIDTEGHELAVLTGASKALADGRINAVQFEFNEMNVISHVFLRDFFSILPEYDFFRLLPDGFLPLERGNAPLGQELFAFQNIVAVRRGA